MHCAYANEDTENQQTPLQLLPPSHPFFRSPILRCMIKTTPPSPESAISPFDSRRQIQKHFDYCESNWVWRNGVLMEENLKLVALHEPHILHSFSAK